MIDRDALKQQAAALGVALDAAQLERFDRFAALLVETNRLFNLTSITEPEEIVTKHFADSLTMLRAVRPVLGASVIDVGAGAGFPSVPLAIARPDLAVTAVDSLKKRVSFMQQAAQLLDLSLEAVHLRAEEGGRLSTMREQFDLAVARAVASLPVLCEYCLPYVRVGGMFVAMKGPDAEQEIADAEPAFALLGARLLRVCTLTLAHGERRTIVVLEKISQLSTKYPRNQAKIKKYPLTKHDV